MSVCPLGEGERSRVGELTAETWQSRHSHGTPTPVLAQKGKAGKPCRSFPMNRAAQPLQPDILTLGGHVSNSLDVGW